MWAEPRARARKHAQDLSAARLACLRARARRRAGGGACGRSLLRAGAWPLARRGCRREAGGGLTLGGAPQPAMTAELQQQDDAAGAADRQGSVGFVGAGRGGLRSREGEGAGKGAGGPAEGCGGAASQRWGGVLSCKSTPLHVGGLWAPTPLGWVGVKLTQRWVGGLECNFLGGVVWFCFCSFILQYVS